MEQTARTLPNKSGTVKNSIMDSIMAAKWLFYKLHLLPGKKANLLAQDYFQKGTFYSEKMKECKRNGDEIGKDTVFLKALRAFEKSVGISHNSDTAYDFIQAAIKIIQEKPSKEAFCELGEICFSRGFYSEARNIAELALEVHPNFSDAYLLLGTCSLHRYLELKEKPVSEMHLLNEKNGAMGRLLESAKANLEKALELFYGANRLEQHGLINDRLNWNEFGGASSYYQHSKLSGKLDKRKAETHYQLGILYHELKQSEDAMRHFGSALKLGHPKQDEITQRIVAAHDKINRGY